VLALEDRVYISNAHDDSVTVISAKDRKILTEIPLRVPRLEAFRGIMPAGMAYDPVNKWLLVAEAGINAVGVIDTASNALIAHLPVGWLPTRVVISGDRVFVANTRGAGTGPNLRRPLMEFGEQPFLHRGSVSTFIIPAKSELPKLSGTVYAANGFVPTAQNPEQAAPALPAAIRHVVLIVKENRTYDEVMGDIPQAADSMNGHVRAANYPALARFGMHGLADGRRTHFSVKDAAITPNHHLIARRWAFSDNFYADSDVSAGGHHWLTGAYPDLLTLSGLLTAYGGQREFVPGSDSSTLPEEQPEAGTLWHHLERNGISFRNFGEGFDLTSTNVPMPDPLYRNTSREYPGFNMNIPDQYRADRFIAEAGERYGKDGTRFPGFVFIRLPGDRLGKERPEDGYPYQASYVEDNDLALGRILEYLSHTPWWREMAVFVTEDGAQGGLDHVDSHRTVLLAAGPYVKRNYITHTNSSFPGLLKTIFELLRMPPLNLMDATAAGLHDIFSNEPDFTPYDPLIPDVRIFDAAHVRVGYPPQ
jgi:YVTN family beta-propeller protein